MKTTSKGVNLGCVSRYLQSHWFYVENNKFNVDPSNYRNKIENYRQHRILCVTPANFSEKLKQAANFHI